MQKFFLALSLTFLLISFGQAQVLKVKVSAQYSHLPTEEQNDLNTFADKVEQYFNGYDWTEDEFEYDVDCTVQIIIESVQSKKAEKIYKAQFVISSVSGENFYDKYWEFPYTESRGLNHSNIQFDPVTGILDYYAYMVLAGEMDTNGELLGTQFYDRALDVANEALLSEYQTGWATRITEHQKIMDTRNKPLRLLKPHFLEATLLMEEGNIKEAMSEAEYVMHGLREVYKMQPNSKPLQAFFNAHYKELGKLFRGRKKHLDELIRFDSKHRNTYREMID